MNRRGFLGFLGAGAVAGPTVAKNALVEAKPIFGDLSVMGSIPGHGSMWGELPSSDHSGGFLSELDRINKLTRLLSGEETEEPDLYDAAWHKESLAEHHINSLGSVSKSAKIRMMFAAHNRIQAEKQRGHWMRELLILKKL